MRRSRTLALGLALALLQGVPGCDPVGPGAGPGHAPAPPAAAATADGGATAQAPAPAGRVAYSWVDQDGRIRLADSPEDVPPAFRDRVVVTDLSRARDERLRADRAVLVDLRQVDNGKPLNYSLVDLARLARPAEPLAGAREPGELARRLVRLGLERLGEAVGLSPPRPTRARVVLYTAPWCGFCRKAAAFLRERGVAFELRDIEAEPEAAAELARKLRQAGLRDAGIPVLDIGGQLVVGFDRPRITALLGG
ncbi:MAG TPA: glutaredoxin domain-containing protein [Myxococcota bacterium]|nr:glutaredoxin domain-containing protein [Myxococcota bacterium]HRY91933.1 glutaredoxin domain-containing protein [Myxococcota bacterium]HSA22282.1 glutaredoxin domain-containing protein [Myxococcota bacterium]